MPARILIVEDNPDHAQITKKILTNADSDYQSDLTDNLEHALNVISSQNYDLILSDYRLPNFSALDLLKKIKEKNTEIPFVVVTSQGSEKIAVELMKQGASDYVTKDDSYYDVLPVVIKRSIARHREKQEKEKLERKIIHAAKKNEDQREFIEKVINSLNYPFYVVNTEYTVILTNEEARNRRIIEGSRCYEAAHKAFNITDKTDLCPLQEVISAKKSISLEHSFLDEKGADVILEIHGVPIMDAIGNVVQMIEYAVDITERKRKEKELEQTLLQLKSTQQQLIQIEKMQVVGGLATGIAHEVKNPLAIILQGVDFLSRKVAVSDKNIQKTLAYMEDAIKRADNIIKGLLDFSSSTIPDIKMHNFNLVFDEALLLAKHQFDKNRIKIVKEFEPDIPNISIDKNKIEQMLVNLFLNAANAMPRGGAFTVKAYLKKLAETDSDTGRRQTDIFSVGETVLTVEMIDTGIGIPTENIDKIFDPFFTTRRGTGGTGLGLAVVRNIIDMHAGNIKIINKNKEEGSGIRAIIRLKIKNQNF